MRISRSFCNLTASVIASAIGIITLLGLFSSTGYPEVITGLFLQWVAVTAAIAILIGLVNLFSVHIGRLTRLERGSQYSFIVLIAAIVVIVLRLMNLRTSDTDEPLTQLVFEALVISLESALGGMLFFFLVYGAYRLLQRRLTGYNCLFMTALAVALIGWIPLQGLEGMAGLRNWLLEIPVTAGARGILIGIALGTVVVGMRVLIGQDQAYREQ